MPNRNLILKGNPVKSFDALAIPANGTAGTRYALPRDRPVMITWRHLFDVAPTACSVCIRTSLNDVDAEMAVLDTSIVMAGEMRTIGPIVANFIEGYLTTCTAGGAATVTLEIEVA
uniref:Uncharacterized protein n=1 Tax=viral metagenome TaxID=1070528 RepID=A0A6M3LH60_9ZZZZ